MSLLSEQILKVAKSFVGKSEKPGNTGFHDAVFEKKMRAIGFYTGAPWCAFTGELIWHDAFSVIESHSLALVAKYFSGNAVETFNKFQRSKEFRTSKTVPKLGAVVIWAHGEGPSGHLGIVTAIKDATNFTATEGNGSAAGSREGTLVVEKGRIVGAPKGKGLNLVGFVYPDRIA